MDTFAFVINYLNELWTPMHVIVGLFEMHDTTWISMARQLQALLEKFDLMHRVVAFVKDGGNNLTSIATSLHSIVDCQPLKLQCVYKGSCFGDVMSKAC